MEIHLGFDMISEITHLLLGFKRLVSVLFGPNLTHVKPQKLWFWYFLEDLELYIAYL